MRVTVYNSLSASNYWRLAAVLTESRHYAVIELPGTQRRVAVDAPLCQSHKFEGYRCGACESNRSAGVSLLFSARWFRQGHLRRVYSPPLSLSGRCGAAVIKNGLGHFCYTVLYLPPKPSRGGEATPWRKTPDATFKWTDGLRISLTTSCLPVLMLDLNDRLGDHGPMNQPDLIGTVGAGIEADSATRLRALLRRQFLAVPSTFCLATPTFYGTSGRSRIDFVAAPPTAQYSRVFCHRTQAPVDSVNKPT